MPRTMRRTVGTGALVVDLAACSGGSAKTAPPTKAQYIQQANAICKEMNDALDAIADPGSDPGKYADAIDEVHDVIYETATKLRDVPMPTGEEDALLAIYSKVDIITRDLANLGAAVRAADVEKINRIEATLGADQDAANDASNAYGLTVCGS